MNEVIKTDSSESVESNQQKIRNRKDYWCFVFMMASTLAAVGFFQGIADKAVGKKNKHAPSILLTVQYTTEIIVNFGTSYWSKWLSYNKRIALCSSLFVLIFVTTALIYDKSADDENNTSLLYPPRIIILCCVALNAAAALVGEISLLQFVASYDKNCINGLSTGGGLGAIIGAALAIMVEVKSIPTHFAVGSCILLPITLLIFYFYFLPLPQPRQSLAEQTTLQLEIGGEQQTELEQTVTDLSAFAAVKKIIIGFWQYSVPLMATYFIFEFTRGAFIKRVWSSTGHKTKYVYKFFNLFFRAGSFTGKSSTNFIQTKQYWIFPLTIFIFSTFIAFIFGMKSAGMESTGFVHFFVSSTSGHWVLYTLIAYPLGIAYGSTSANVFYTMRERIKNSKLREFALGNIRQTISYGQILGAVCSLPFKK